MRLPTSWSSGKKSNKHFYCRTSLFECSLTNKFFMSHVIVRSLNAFLEAGKCSSAPLNDGYLIPSPLELVFCTCFCGKITFCGLCY